MKLIIKNANIVNPAPYPCGRAVIVIEKGRISEVRYGDRGVGYSASGSGDFRVIDARGMYVMPGLVDMHAHLREPGFEHKETIKTGTNAAQQGGFTTVCCMPNTNPPNDNAEVTRLILDRAAESGSCRVLPIGAVTKGQLGFEPVDFDALSSAGCVAFSDDGRPVMNSAVMRKALEYSALSGSPIISHCEDSYLAEGGIINEGDLAVSLGVRGAPAAAEEIMLARDSILAGITRGKLHIAHVSTKGSVELVRRAKNDGIDITAETCPHYFSITEEAVRIAGAYAKVNPPLRTQQDVEAIKEGLKDGAIDVIATDHAPHHIDEKALGLLKAPFGISGLETALALSLRLVHDGVLSLYRLVEKMSFNPSRILGIQGGVIEKGAAADIVIVDIDKEWIVAPESFASMGRNTPFAGWKLNGKAELVIHNGKVLDMRDSAI